MSFYWQSSYYWSVSPNDNADLYVKVSLDGGTTWQPYIWTFGEIGVWPDFIWQETTLDLSTYSGENIMVAFNIVANDNSDIALDNVYIGDGVVKTPGTISMSNPCIADARSKVSTGCESFRKHGQSISRSVFTEYAIYRDDVQIGQTSSTTYTDENLPIGMYTYYVTAVYTSPDRESDPSNEVVAEIKREADIKRLPNGYSPVIDGEVDEIWNNVEANNIDRDFTGETPTLDYATWKAVWNDTYIYVLVEVNEDSFWPTWLSGAAEWESDKSEVYFDVNDILIDNGGPSASAGHYQFAPNFSQFDPGTAHDFNGATVADIWSLSPAGYVYEYRIPFSSLTDLDGIALNPYSRTEVGFDLCIIDLDEGQVSRNRSVWSNIGTTQENWFDMDDAGLIYFSTDEIEPPSVNAPQNLAAQVVNNNDVRLEWDAVKQAYQSDVDLAKNAEQNLSQSVFSKYAVYRDGDKIKETTSISYTDQNLAAGTYTYYVTALYISPSVESYPSNVVHAHISITGVPSIDTPPSTDVILYPIPATDKLNMVLNGFKGSVSLEIYNLLGKAVYQKNIESQGIKQREQIMLNGIAPGIYCMKISNQDKSCVVQFSIK